MCEQALPLGGRGPDDQNWRGVGRQVGRPFSRQERVHIKVEFDWPGKLRRDPANYHPTPKALVNGMVDAGFRPDDNDRYPDGPGPRRCFDVIRVPV